MAEENMTGKSDKPTHGARLLPLYSLATMLAAIVGFLSVILYDRLIVPSSISPLPAAVAADTASSRSGHSGLANLVRPKSLKTVDDFSFLDGNGSERKLSDWRGKVVLVNLWATWCAPCKVEMPGLNRLQAKLGGDDFAVLPISLDFGGIDKPKRYLEKSGLDKLGFYGKASVDLMQKFRAPGLPFTMLINRRGHEIARLAGPAEWDSEEALALIREVVANDM